MEEWKEYKLGNITIMKNGKKRPQNSGCYPVYGGNGIMDYSDSYNSERTIVVGRVGAYCGCVYKSENRCWVSDNAIAVYAKDNVDFLYLYYMMTCLDFHHHHIGGAQPLMTQDIIGDFIVKLPSLETQRQIASILSSLDDKIELNRKINANLEAQAQALFKSWFVDFEPFKDQPFVESELGMIPEGWRVGTLGEICNQSSIKVGCRNDVKVLSPVTTGNLMLSEEYFTKQVFSESIAKYKVVAKGAFAYNPARVNIGSLGRNEYDFDGAVSPVYVVFECKDGYENFFDLYRRTERFKTEVLLRAIGGVRQSLNYTDFAMIQTVIAPQNVIDAFNPLFDNIKVTQRHLEKENSRLASLRDTLLPRLMSGELKVNEVI